MQIEPIIMDKNFNELAVIDDYISFIWATRYYTNGEFELYLDINDIYINLIQKDYYIKRDDDENIGIIQSISIETDSDQHEVMAVKGKFISCILERRIIAVQTQLRGTVSAGIYNLIQDNVIAPSIPERKINNFYVNNTNFSKRLEAQYTGKNLLETIEDICKTYHLGFKTTLNNRNEMIFTLYEGTDRSYNQNVNPYVIFSDEFDNLLSSKYSENYENIITDVLVAGEGEGLNRKTLWVNRDKMSGLNRYEAYQDQRNLSTNEGTVTDDDYYKQMEEEGLESLTSITNAFNGTVYFDNYKYNKDIFMGDICVIENRRWGIYTNSRLVEIIESVNESGEYSISPTFGI